jgi:hypothetical protein
MNFATALIWCRKTPARQLTQPINLIAESKFAWKNLKKQMSAEKF